MTKGGRRCRRSAARSSFVVGATGIVGGYIVEHLVKSGEIPLALSRGQQCSSGVVWLQGDLAKPKTLKPLATTDQ
jgi:uncharacterized protein YbjT (DUF2867 family)